jgi:hypothetical protein
VNLKKSPSVNVKAVKQKEHLTNTTAKKEIIEDKEDKKNRVKNAVFVFPHIFMYD